MTDAGAVTRRGPAHPGIDIERASGLVERGLELAAALSNAGFVSISARRAHTLAIKRDGSLWSWGCSPHGALGLGDTETSSPTRVGEVELTQVAPR